MKGLNMRVILVIGAIICFVLAIICFGVAIGPFGLLPLGLAFWATSTLV